MSPHAWREPLPLKTYPLGPPDPNPPFQRQNHTWACYPYPLLDDVLEGQPTVRDWNALHIENEYLHCLVLPELGGHLYSLFDKVTGREVFYRNNVVKYGLVAIRGAWIAGGIEFNFPTGHTYTTVSPVGWEVGEDESGAWLAVGNICRVSRMEWWVKLTLEPRRRRLKEEVWLHNPMPYKQRHWFWNNSAVPARDDLRLVYPAWKARMAGGIVDYPIHSGIDWSRYVNHKHADDIFTLDVEEDFFGCHYDDFDFGMVHVADREKLKGKKFFTWGAADDGMAWVDLLTDDDGQYVEIQSGLFETQSEWGWLQPFETKNWEEYWLPEHGMDGWVWANEKAVLNVESRDAFIQVGATVTGAVEGARLELQVEGESVWSEETDLDPATPFAAQVPVPVGPDWKGELVLTQGDTEILRYVHPPGHTMQPKVAETGENVVPKPKSEDECAAEELCERADRAMLRLEHEEARRLYELARERDRESRAAEAGLALLNQRCGRDTSSPALPSIGQSSPAAQANRKKLAVARAETGDWQPLLEAAFAAPDAATAIRLFENLGDLALASTDPMVHYSLACWYAHLGNEHEAEAARRRGRACSPDLCFPSRLEELAILEWAVDADPSDWKARLHLGNLLSSFDRYDEAMVQWHAALELDDSYAVLHRNLGFGALHWEENAEEGAEHYRRALGRNPDDHRYYLDLQDLHAKHLGKSAEEQLALLRSAPEAVQEKWQVAARIAELLVNLRRHDEALAILQAHRFFPWEGRTHMRTIWVRCLTGRGEAAIERGDHKSALADFELAMTYPRNLGVGKPEHPQDARIHWLAAREAETLGLEDKRQQHLASAAEEPHRGMCEADAYKVLALRALGRADAAGELERQVREWLARMPDDARRQATAAAVHSVLATGEAMQPGVGA